MAVSGEFDCIGVIPARYHSTRFPGKVLEPIDGLPMAARVYKQAKGSRLQRVLVSTDHTDVFKAMEDLDIPVIMTSETCRSGTERVAEAALSIEGDVFVNIQGDEPYIEPEIINLVIDQFNINQSIEMATVSSTNLTAEDWEDPDIVKVETAEDGTAMTFFRTPSPHAEINRYTKHLGIYGFKKEFLLRFAQMEKTENEISLDLEQMRALDQGIPISVAITDLDSIGINRPEDIQRLKEKATVA
ncbi:MAG: 3-deoxy-manno-octulosonate cytidylyltransferase [Candidatus Marinimicrobia bacterium]|nr:3-deoxy-manno-octulosonate cytidylyltransferase [Candidatus Neomarinimicrobiota bacterium]|tara:strand:- start:3427 stop:4158 length:732 start_codon:yes stop_codon:yes gene_type:complete